MIDEEGFEQFGFAALRMDRNRAALRLGFHGPYVGMGTNAVRSLGLWVELTPEYRTLLRGEDPLLIGEIPVQL